MKWISLVFLSVLFVATFGCDSDDDSSATTGTTTLAQGTKTAAGGSATVLATVSVAQEGTLVATVTWSGAPATLTAYFKHSGATNYGWVDSASPLTSTVNITAAEVAAGSSWTLYASPGANPVDVTYLITFTPN